MGHHDKGRSKLEHHPSNPGKRVSSLNPGTNPGKSVDQLQIVFSGWVLKKKRKKMQGYAKRYLILTSQGILTYTMSPDKPTRDSIEIPHASVTSSKRHGTIHVDSGSSVFHLKMLNEDDFEAWRNHLRSFIPQRSTDSAPRIYVSTGTDLVAVDLSQVFVNLDTSEKLIREVDEKVSILKQKGVGQKTATEAIVGAFSSKSENSVETHMNTLAALLEQLKSEHDNLKNSIESKIPRVTGPQGTMDSIKSRQGIAGMESGSRPRSRMSISSLQTTQTDSAIFYDADSMAGEEHVLDDETSKDDGDVSRDEVSSDGDEDDDEDSGLDETTLPSSRSPTDSVSSSSAVIQRRTKLPAKVSGDEVSLFSMLKKNVGKDLSTISFPVSFNCPLSLLQAAAEEFEYAPELLGRAAKTEDWVERICLVGAFAVSGYASTRLRASRKPFNPLLGETFECLREDKNLRFVAEKVVHQPPIVATHAEGKGWTCSGWSCVKNKFWGKSLELIPEGSLRLELHDGDAFTLVKPSSFMRNLLAGNKYLEHVGELTVTNENTGQRLVIEFKEGTLWGGLSSRNSVAGTVYDANGSVVTHLRGKWTDNLAIQKDKENYQLVWEASEMPPHADDYYGFTYFAMSLNEIAPGCDESVLPPTDSRLRPDQRHFENGEVDQAEATKQRLEEEQRARRRKMEAQGVRHQPRWFHQDAGDKDWKFGGPNGEDYFKARKEAEQGSWDKAWKNVPKIFS
ncbi:hypothetical protein IE53DRAFT_371781 [Violaceomyces palustris]|uniref:Uncharacterized protein n=1 Tax=Violaceomyces palustris TaxID=1673888 RepID=A0ACD0NML7_9BASI|nr:hypothetical protein IE53DRAFT_371781 [Violaceomyces palustris]